MKARRTAALEVTSDCVRLSPTHWTDSRSQSNKLKRDSNMVPAPTAIRAQMMRHRAHQGENRHHGHTDIVGQQGAQANTLHGPTETNRSAAASTSAHAGRREKNANTYCVHACVGFDTGPSNEALSGPPKIGLSNDWELLSEVTNSAPPLRLDRRNTTAAPNTAATGHGT